MAYKFQLGDSVLSGALEQEGDIKASAGVLSASSHVQAAGNLAVAGTSTFVGAISGSGKLEVAGKSFFGDSLVPNQDGQIDLGSSAKEFKDLYIDGVAYIDSLQADQLGAALDANNQAITNINVDSGAIDNAVIGANTAAAGTFTTLVAGGDVDLGDATSDTITATGRFDSDLVPSSDSARALGTSALQWSAVHVDVGHIDQLGSALDANSQAITNINVDSGAMDGVVIGANSAAAATLSTLKVSDLTAERVPFIGTAGEIEDSADFGYNDDGMGGGKFFQVRSKGPAGNNFASIMAKTGSIVVLNAAEDALLAYLGHDGVVSGSSFESAGNITLDGNVLPYVDDASDLGSSAKQFKDLYLDGVAYIDSLQADQLGAALDANSQAITNVNIDSGAIDGTTVGASSQAAGKFTTLSGSGAFSAASTGFVRGAMTLGAGLTAASLGTIADGDIDVTADLMIANDSGTGAIKNMSLANYAGKIAGVGLAAAAGALKLDLNELSALGSAGVVAADQLVFVDASDDSSKKVTMANFLTSIAGAGISVSSGKLVSDASPTPQNIGDSAGTLAEGMNFSSANFSAARTWTLPASPDAGDVVSVKAPANAATYNLTIAVPASETIDGAASVVIESDRGALDLVYVGSDAWVIR